MRILVRLLVLTLLEWILSSVAFSAEPPVARNPPVARIPPVAVVRGIVPKSEPSVVTYYTLPQSTYVVSGGTVLNSVSSCPGGTCYQQPTRYYYRR